MDYTGEKPILGPFIHKTVSQKKKINKTNMQKLNDLGNQKIFSFLFYASSLFSFRINDLRFGFLQQLS